MKAIIAFIYFMVLPVALGLLVQEYDYRLGFIIGASLLIIGVLALANYLLEDKR